MHAHNNFHDFLTAHYNDTVDTHDSAITILYDYYAESNEAIDPEIQDALKLLRDQLPTGDVENIMSTVFKLCTLHEECGFRGGLNMGMTLAKELSSLE